jgi:hypothetical protein
MSWNYRLSTLELSSSFPTIVSTTTNSSRLSPLERRLAKYRSLSFLWLRTCTSSKRRTFVDNQQKNTIYVSLNHFGRLKTPHPFTPVRKVNRTRLNSFKKNTLKVFYDPRH